MMRYYPVNLDVRGRDCLVVGGGEVARRKVRALVEAGASVRVVAPSVDPRLKADPRVHVEEREFRDVDLHNAVLVIVATDDAVLNRSIARGAADFGCLVNVVDCPALSNFIVPAALRRGELLIAVSTAGASPMLARRIREKLEKEFGEEYADFVALLAEVRKVVLDTVADGKTRARIFTALTDDRMLELLRAKGRDATKEEMMEAVRQISKSEIRRKSE
jgi:precorrin-2 dehydrogenase/sirohydrochlorin ferrochelatase